MKEVRMRRCHKCQHPFAGRERGAPLVVAVSGWLTNARHNMTHDPCPDTSLWSIKPSQAELWPDLPTARTLCS